MLFHLLIYGAYRGYIITHLPSITVIIYLMCQPLTKLVRHPSRHLGPDKNLAGETVTPLMDALDAYDEVK